MRTLARAIDAGCSNLKRSLDDYYWPALGANEISERNISFYTAAALAACGFRVFAEPNFSPLRTRKKTTGRRRRSIRHRRLDFLALSKDRRYRIVVEAKRFYSAGKATEIAIDIGRMRRFRLLKKWTHTYHLVGKRTPTHGLIVATTWQRNYMEWWCKPSMRGPTRLRGGAPAKPWKRLCKCLSVASVASWAAELSSNPTSEDENRRQQYALIALFKFL
jgi:hypothetical protein